MFPFVGVVLDACAIFPASLRDTLLRAVDANLYTIQLTDDILEEVCRNLVNKRCIQAAKAQKLANVIKEKFDEGFITIPKQLINSMPINEKDRHVLAAAVASGAQIIVTQNLKDFPPHLLDQFNVNAQSLDEFLVHLFDFDSIRMIQIVLEQVSELHNPPRTVPEVLDSLMQHAPRFASFVRRELQGGNVYPSIILE
jgi:predicted nucleic acid-binding protein